MALTEFATEDVVTTSADTDLRDVIEQMDEHDVGSVVIVDDDELTGIVTDRMIAMAFTSAESVDEVSLDDIMTTDPVTIEVDATHFEALETMSDQGIRRLPVTENGSITGIISLDDLIVVTASELSMISDVVEQQAGPL